ncbi:MAG TPA: hypothetical protein VFD42_07340, partial [Chloroflexota bacterium]|nr:hypothetical protein [Chloroflexota bacterium]
METRSGDAMPVPGVVLEGAGDGGSALVERLVDEDFLGQLLRREGRAMELGSEGAKPQLDWVDGIERALARPELLAAVEEEAAGYLRRGYRHLVWSGMGGSVMAV